MTQTKADKNATKKMNELMDRIMSEIKFSVREFHIKAGQIEYEWKEDMKEEAKR